MVKYKLDPNSGSLKDPDLFRRFFICMNYESRFNGSNQTIGLFIQYGIFQGYESKQIVHLSYFDDSPLEPRYYMFGSHDSKVSVYDINVNLLSRDEEAQLRCATDNMTFYDEIRCKNLCHDNCIGCSKANSSSSCIKCRYDSYKEENRLICLETCPIGYEKNSLLHKCEGYLEKF